MDSVRLALVDCTKEFRVALLSKFDSSVSVV